MKGKDTTSRIQDSHDSKLQKLMSEAAYKSFVSKQPVFFNKNFILINNIVAFILGFYILSTTILYFSVHFNFGNIIKSKTLLLEYDAVLFGNLLVNFFFSLFLILNYIAIKKSEPSFYPFLAIGLITLNYLHVSNITGKEVLILESIKILKGIMLFTAASLICYIILFFIRNLIHMRNYLSDNFSFKQIYHEISLRTDLMKFSYNHFIIRFKLHKFFPGLLYPRSSFYYVSLNKNNISQPKMYEENSSVQLNYENDEKQKLLSGSSAKFAYLSTQGEF